MSMNRMMMAGMLATACQAILQRSPDAEPTLVANAGWKVADLTRERFEAAGIPMDPIHTGFYAYSLAALVPAGPQFTDSPIPRAVQDRAWEMMQAMAAKLGQDIPEPVYEDVGDEGDYVPEHDYDEEDYQDDEY